MSTNDALMTPLSPRLMKSPHLTPHMLYKIYWRISQLCEPDAGNFQRRCDRDEQLIGGSLILSAQAHGWLNLPIADEVLQRRHSSKLHEDIQKDRVVWRSQSRDGIPTNRGVKAISITSRVKFINTIALGEKRVADRDIVESLRVGVLQDRVIVRVSLFQVRSFEPTRTGFTNPIVFFPA